MYSSNFVSTPGLRIHYLQQGTARSNRDPIIFLHGFPQTSHQWRHQIRALSDEGYACFAPDNRGFGQTDKPLLRISRALLARDLINFMDALGIQSAHLVAHDWGGIIGFKAIADYASRISTYTMIDTLCTVWAPLGLHGYWFKAEGLAEEFFAKYHREFIDYLFGNGDGSDLPARPQSPWAVNPGRARQPDWIDAEDLNHYRKSFSDPASHHAAVQYYRYGLPFHRMTENGEPKLLSESEVAAMWLYEGGIEKHPLFNEFFDYAPEDNTVRYNKPALMMYGAYRYGQSVKQGDTKIRSGNPFDDQFTSYFPNLSACAVNGVHFLGEESSEFVNAQLIGFLQSVAT